VTERSNHTWIVAIGLPVVVLVFYLTAALHFSYTPDDTYIYLQFAKNVVRGAGVSFNAGEPTYGITGPLWMMLIAVGGWLGVDLYIAAKGLDLLLAGFSLIVFFLLAFEVLRDQLVALLATLAFSSNVWLIRWAGSGMETSLSVLLALATVLWTLRNQYALAIVTAGALTLVRPEAVWLAGLVLIDLRINSVDWRLALRKITTLVMVYVALLIPWHSYAYARFGTIISNTARAKSEYGWDLFDTAAKFINSLRIIAASDGLAVLMLFVCAAVLLVQFQQQRRKAGVDGINRFYLFRQSFVGISWLILLPILYAMFHLHTVSRYLLLVTPFITLFAFVYLVYVLAESRFRRYSYAGAAALAAAILLQSQIVYSSIVKPGIQDFDEGMQTSLVAIGKWLGANAEPGARILLWDIGAVGYYSDRPVCDGAGLATPEMIPYVRRGYSLREIVQDGIYASMCSDVRYIVHRSTEPEELKHIAGLVPVMTTPFRHMGMVRYEQQYYTLYRIAIDHIDPHLTHSPKE
jgi:hypothetical protein